MSKVKPPRRRDCAICHADLTKQQHMNRAQTCSGTCQTTLRDKTRQERRQEKLADKAVTARASLETNIATLDHYMKRRRQRLERKAARARQAAKG